MKLLLELLSDTLQIIRFVVVCNYFIVLEKRRNKFFKFIPLIIIIGISFFILLTENVIIQSLVYYICIFFLIISLYKEKWWKIPILTIWLICLVEMFSQMSVVLVESLFRILNIDDELEVIVIIEQMVALIIMTVISLLVYHKNKQGIRTVSFKSIFFFTCICAADCGMLIFMADFTKNMVDTNNRIRFKILFVVLVVGMLAQLVMLIWNIVVRNGLIENETLLKKYLEEQREHYEYLEKREEETKKFRHDLRNHMYMLQNLYEQQDENNIRKYFEEMNDKIGRFGNKISVNYSIADAVLNKYISMAQDCGIDMYVSGHFPMNCELSPYDLCTILSNLLSNALEAAEQCVNGQIRVEFSFDERYVIIIVENNYIGELSYENGRIQTKKKNKSNHGIGLNNILECVKHNRGDLDISIENQRFKVRVFLKYTKKQQERV